MVDLDFAVEGAEMEPYAAAPLLLFKLRLTNTTSATPVQNVMLQCQIRIEPTHRQYAPSEHEPLSELFGTPDRWGTTLHSMLWTYANVLVPPFETGCTFNFPVSCSYDFNVAATKYFYGLVTARYRSPCCSAEQFFIAMVRGDCRSSRSAMTRRHLIDCRSRFGSR